MPELPEVEVVRRGASAWLVGQTIHDVTVLDNRVIRPRGATIAARLRGATVRSAERRGKYLWFPLDDGEDALQVHLGMSGQVLVRNDSLPQRHERVRISLAGEAPDIVYADQRMFGYLRCAPLIPAQGRMVPQTMAHIAPDPLEDVFEDESWQRHVRRKKTAIKRVLLDQSIISGVGNIYADEALWRAKLYYDRPSNRLTRRAALGLLGHLRDVMTEALQAGGTSFDSLYVNVNGESGYFARGLNAYGREGEPCRRCGAMMKREPYAGRSSFRCPRCQRRS